MVNAFYVLQQVVLVAEQDTYCLGIYFYGRSHTMKNLNTASR